MLTALKIGLAAFIAIFLCLSGLFVYLGGFRSITIVEQTSGPYLLAYRELPVVNFSKFGEITTGLNQNLRALGLTPVRPFDIFYPDQRAEIGFIIESADSARVAQAGGSILVKTIPAQRFITTTFPWKTSLSYLVGFMKVDPAFVKYRESHGMRKTWAATEHEGDSILYLQPIEKE